jgi:hypothetical protein
MGYNTNFTGDFSLNKFLKPEHKAYLQRFATIRHEPLDEEALKQYPDPLREAVGLPIGKYGMYFTGLIDPDGAGDDLLNGFTYGIDEMNVMQTLHIYDIDTLIDEEPGTNSSHQLWLSYQETHWAPSLYCQWVPTNDGRGIKDEGEKFYGYIAWLRFLLEHFLLPWGYELSGEVSYQGEQGEHGKIVVTHNEVSQIIEGDSLLPRSKESPGSAF